MSNSTTADGRPQHLSPCRECPFSRAATDEDLAKGGSQPERYIGQAYGPFLLPCHMDPKYSQADCGLHMLQCAGAAIFRANCGVADRMPDALLRAEPDAERVFASPAELLARHARVGLDEAEAYLGLMTPDALLRLELLGMNFSPNARTIEIPGKKKEEE